MNCQDLGGTTPLHWVVKEGNLECVKVLVEHGADATCLDKNGESPYDIATATDHNDILDLLAKVKQAALKKGPGWKELFIKVGISQENATKYEQLFVEKEVDTSLIGVLSSELLAELGISAIGDRIRILKLKHKVSHYYLTDITIEKELNSGRFG